MRDLLFEIGMEEIPAGFLQPALTQLQDLFTEKAAERNFGHGPVKVMGTPRRLVLVVNDVEERQKDTVEELLGPAKKAAFDGEGKPTKALEGFARSKGVAVKDLRPVETPKGEYMMLTREVKGTDTVSLLPGVLQSLILELSFPKSMRWGRNRQSFARPIQWLVALFGEELLCLNHEGIASSNISIGHRFLDKRPVLIKDAAHYEQQLEDRFVLADPIKRRSQVIEEIKRAVAESEYLREGNVAIDEGLVDTVTNLVEMPFGVCGIFEEKFLQLPAEVLITSMREHQKYFPVVDSSGKLLPGFVAVNNTRVHDTSITRKGHQRVLRARLEDALFFFNSDRENRLENHVANLHGIIFQAKLGTMLEKQERLVKLAKILADKINPRLADDSCRAALLCKADLLSNMVGEFPSLQGVMGGAYALHDGERESVATAIVEHYMPKRAGADIPATDVGAILALADRFDTLAGCFGIGQVPTGTADPFGLRRISLAILNIIQGKGYSFSLRELIHKSLALYGDKVAGGNETVNTVLNFVKARFTNDCVSRGYEAEAVEAAASVNFDDVNECLLRINAMVQLKKEPAFNVLAASYKRIRNIIKDNNNTEINPTLFAQEAESKLYKLFLEVRLEVEKLVAAREYVGALEVMLKMKEPVDSFFAEVMVMAEDMAVRQNRLNLLTALGDLILQVGDISKFQES